MFFGLNEQIRKLWKTIEKTYWLRRKKRKSQASRPISEVKTPMADKKMVFERKRSKSVKDKNAYYRRNERNTLQYALTSEEKEIEENKHKEIFKDTGKQMVLSRKQKQWTKMQWCNAPHSPGAFVKMTSILERHVLKKQKKITPKQKEVHQK